MGWLSGILGSDAWATSSPAGGYQPSATGLSFTYDPQYVKGLELGDGRRRLTEYELQGLTGGLSEAGLGGFAERLVQRGTAQPLITPTTGINWQLDSPEWRRNLELGQLNREGGDIIGPAYGEMFGNQTPGDAPEFDPNKRSGYAYDPANDLIWRAKFDASGKVIPGSVTRTSTEDEAFGLAAMAAMAVTGANIGAAGAFGGGGLSGNLGSTALSSADKAALFGDVGYGAGMTGAETAAFDAGLSGLGGLPQASYSLEGGNYGIGGLNPATSSPVNSSLGFDWGGLGSKLQQAGRGLNLVSSLGGQQQQQGGGGVVPSLGFRSPRPAPEAAPAPVSQTLVLQPPQNQPIQLPDLAGAQGAVLNDIRQWMAKTGVGSSVGGRK